LDSYFFADQLSTLTIMKQTVLNQRLIADLGCSGRCCTFALIRSELFTAALLYGSEFRHVEKQLFPLTWGITQEHFRLAKKRLFDN
jgi:hypothetical protein